MSSVQPDRQSHELWDRDDESIIKMVEEAVLATGREGMTVSEVRGALDAHHGTASSVLNSLEFKQKKIVRLEETRPYPGIRGKQPCVYVGVEYIEGRPLAKRRRKAAQGTGGTTAAPESTGRLTDFQNETYALYTVQWFITWTSGTKTKGKVQTYSGEGAQDQTEEYIAEIEESARQRTDVQKIKIEVSKTSTQRAERTIGIGRPS